jgi:hypothetical protein
VGTVRLHNIRRSDRDRHPHDHPWDFWSLLLTGSYVETRMGGFDGSDGVINGRPVPWVDRLLVPRWSLVRRRAEDLHKLTVAAPLWTLVWTGPRRRDWGFQTEAGWVYWRDYLGVPADGVSRGAP